MWLCKATIFGALVVITSGQAVTGRFCRPGLCEQLCFETAIGYDCRCNGGFYRNPLDPRRCIPMNANCQPGYRPSTRDPRLCEVINPVCLPGYQPSRLNPRICEDIDECSVRNPCQQLCINLRGNYRCGCNNGFYLNPADGKTCVALNGCAPGYAPNPRNNSACEDIDECQRPGLCEQKCLNLRGSYRCSCFAGYHVSGGNNSRCSVIKPCSAAVDIILVLDSTNSVGYTNFQLLVSFLAEFVLHFEVSNRKGKFGALLFSDDVQPLFTLKDYRFRDDVTKAILNAPYLGGVTATNEVFDFVRQNNLFGKEAGGRPNADKYVVLLTDGRSTIPALTRASAENLKNTGVKIVVVGIGDRASVSELNSIASRPEDVLLATDYEHLDYIQEELDLRTCPGADK